MGQKSFIGFNTHAVVIDREEDLIRCFKFRHNNVTGQCEYEVFKDQELATAWIIKPFDNARLAVVFQ